MDRNKFLTIAVVLLLLLNMGTLAFLFLRQPHGPPHHERGPGDFMLRELGWNEEQKNDFKKLRHEHHSAMMKWQEENHALRTQLFELLKTDSANARDVEIQTQIAARQFSMDSFTYLHFRQVRALCKGEQQKHFDEITPQILEKLLPPKPPHGPPPPHH